MKQCSQDFIQELQSLGRQLDCKVEYTLNSEEITLHDELYSISPSFKGNILKSVMKEMVIESSVEIPNETIINVKIGLLINNEEYEYLDFGNYVVFENEKQVDENTYRIKCYDKMVYAMKDYESLGVVYPISIKNYLSALCTKIGLTMKDTNFRNATRQIPSELFTEQGLTYRDVLDQIAQATGSTICIDENDRVEVRYINDTETIVTEHMLKDVNVNVGEKYGPINSIVLSRANADNVYLRDEESVAQNGLHEIKIVDNQIMNFNDRADYLPDLLNALGGLEYYTNDYTSTGLLIYDVCDMYEISITGDPVWKQCIMFNDEITIDGGIEEQVYTELPEEAETDYTKADKTDQRINKTYFIVDKQNQTIESVVENVGEQNEKITQIEQTVDEINSKISDVIDITETQESMNGSLQFDDVNESEPVTINIRSTGEYITLLHPWATGKYPANNLYIKLRMLRFTNTRTSEIFDWELPEDLLYYNENVYDELLIDYETQTAQILKRCRRTGVNSVEPLGTTQIINIPYPSIELTDGDYTVQMLKYDGEPYPCYIKVRVMKQNIYTTQFYTKAEVNSLISQTESSITLDVDQKLSNYSTTTEMNATIAITAQGINSTVSTKVGKNEVISSINQSSEQIQINANRISLVGKTLDCNTENINIVTTTMRITGGGLYFYNQGTSFGYMGSSQYGQDANQKGVLFTLHSNGAFMAWSRMVGNNNYTCLYYVRDNSFGSTYEGIKLGADLYLRGYKLYGSDSRNGYINVLSDGMLEVHSNSQYDLFGVYNDYSQKFVIHRNGNVEVDGNVYANNISSDGRLKKNIEESTESALDIIKQLQHRQFDWKENNEHVPVGYIAQEVEEIAPELIMKRDIMEDGKIIDQQYYMAELPLIATATKAIQEQEVIIEELQNKILQQNELLDIIKERLEIEMEEPKKAPKKAAKGKKTIKQYDNETIKVPKRKEEKPKKTIIKETKNGVELVEEE